MQKRNFQKELDSLLAALAKKEETPTLLMHSCCAPCSSYCLLYLSQYFQVTVFYDNPNITDETEYRRRAQEQKRLVSAYNERIAAGLPLSEENVPAQAMPRADTDGTCQSTRRSPIQWIEGDYAPGRFFAAAKGLEDAPEGGARCEKCFALRLNETAALAARGGFDYFTTTLSISPLKNAVLLNEIGEAAARAHHAVWLPSDFKKKGGYQQSIALSKKYNLYRQNFCGCVFSEREAARKRAEKSVQ